MTRPDIERAIGAALRERRHHRALTQAQLGKAIGVSYQQIQKYETGKNRVSISTALAMAVVLGCDVTAFIPPDEASA